MATWKETHGVPAPILKFKPGEKRKHPVTDERDGSVAGHHVEHYDGSQDAVITAKPVGAKSRLMDGKE